MGGSAAPAAAEFGPCLGRLGAGGAGGGAIAPGCHAGAGGGQLRQLGFGRLHAVLRHRHDLRGPGGGHRLQMRAVQYWRRRPSGDGGAWPGAGLPGPRCRAAGGAAAAARDHWRGSGRGVVGRGSWLAASTPRQPHRHHHHHVQLHRRQPAGLSAGERADRAWADGARDTALRRCPAAACRLRLSRSFASEHRADPGPDRSIRRVVAGLAHALGLRAARRGCESRSRALCRHRSRQAHHSRHGDLGRPGCGHRGE